MYRYERLDDCYGSPRWCGGRWRGGRGRGGAAAWARRVLPFRRGGAAAWAAEARAWRKHPLASAPFFALRLIVTW
jgi:hypothetical protein